VESRTVDDCGLKLHGSARPEIHSVCALKHTGDRTKRKGKSGVQLFIGNPSQSYGASSAIWDHTLLAATRHRWTRLSLTPARQACTQFTYPGGMESWVDLSAG